MPKFQKGQSGNPGGLPKTDKPKTRTTLIREAWQALIGKKPWLVTEALERGLMSSRPLGYLELGARVQKEIGKDESDKQSITIVVNSPLNANTLRPIEIIPMPETQAHPMLPPAPTDAQVLELLESDAK